MAELDAILFFGILPLVGALAAWLATWRRVRLARRDTPAETLRNMRGMIMVLGVLPATLLLFAFAIAFLYVLGPRPVGGAILTYGAAAYGIPALMAGLGQAIVYDRGFPSMVGTRKGFGKVVVGSVFPEVVVEFGFAMSFLILALSRGATPVEVANVARAALLVSVGSLAAPVAALAFVRTKGWESPPGFGRACLRSVAALSVTVVLFGLGFLALRGGL